ncbi:MAG: ribosomal protein S18-alanine N-acetyltransferase [Eubacteriales bacterium]|nr:ribosomal protein S18-alanine N-acetyltransferase [Eubacteriales bacterium]
MKIRPARPSDLSAIVALEQSSFTVPWSKKSIRYELEHNTLAHLFVAEDKYFELQAYAGYHEIVDECEITNICVAKSSRKIGLGTLLLETLLTDARHRGLRRASLEVRPSNHAALALYRKFGFCLVGVRKNYYPDNREDALILATDLVN